MAASIPPPDPYTLLPPLLAALPLSFASSRPPPSLIPLLSPILQQRLQIHSTSPASSSESWPPLLCWDAAKGSKLKETIENANFEPHPTSGEIEIGDTEPVKYRRFDQETFKAQIPLTDWELTALFLWCTSADGNNDGWKLAELIPFDSAILSDRAWSDSPTEAEASFRSAGKLGSSTQSGARDRRPSVQGADEDDYWALYDGTPAQTPARHGSAAQPAAGVTEDEYYARYGSVQPAMDNHDPDEEPGPGIPQPGLVPTSISDSRSASIATAPSHHSLYGAALSTSHLTPPEDDKGAAIHYSHPVPRSPSSRAGSDTISRMEDSADRYTASEVGIRQHISATMKSMYRLARSAGISRDEFDDMVQRELESLSIFDQDD